MNEENPILALLERHGDQLVGLTTDIRDMSLDILILRAIIMGLVIDAKEKGIDLRPACIAYRDLLPDEHRAAFAARLKEMYSISMPI